MAHTLVLALRRRCLELSIPVDSVPGKPEHQGVASGTTATLVGVLDFFGTRWGELTVETLEAFLADAGDEGLTWEAKGRDEPHRDAVRKAGCGFANAGGGFLIIGAERQAAGGWTLNGVTFRSPEPGTWLSSLLAEGGLSPRPPFDVKAFERDDGRVAAVLAVDPVAVPPCVTASGVVYQRVTGQTLPITDQRVLSELFARGRAARDQAEALALRASVRALREPEPLPAEQALFSIAVCPIRGADDKAAVMFSWRFRELIDNLVHTQLQDRMARHSVRVELAQDRLRAWPAGFSTGGGCWTLAVYWDGSVSAVFSAGATELYVDDLIARVHRGWNAVVEAAKAAGGVGEAHLVLRIRGEHAAVTGHREPHPTQPIQRWTELREPTTNELGSLTRELQRGFGQEAWEPEPPPAAG